jgi:ribose transport system ATP-binding protein
VTEPTLLELASLSKTYPGVKALQGVSLTVKAGSVHALVGENGAGKSTLIKSLAGVVEPDEMSLAIRDEVVSIRHAADARKHGLAFIHQELNLIEYFTAPENVFLGHSLPRKRGFLDRSALRRKAAAIFDELDVAIDLNEPVRYLTPGDAGDDSNRQSLCRRSVGLFYGRTGDGAQPRREDPSLRDGTEAHESR